MSDPRGPGDPSSQQQPSEEEVRAYLGQLRAAPAEQVIAEVLSALLNAAQVKMGRRDGRLLLDLSASLIDGAREHLPADMVTQVDDALAQLRVAQVDAEREVAAAASQGHAEPGDLGSDSGAADAGPTDEGAGAPPSATPPQRPEDPPSAASRLWVPGR